MNKSTFDKIIKENVVNAMGFDLFGPTGYPAQYPNHYNSYAFAEFVNHMQTSYKHHYDKYSSGRGNELVSINGKPPKMSSVASSSRFCYLAFRNCNCVDFEHNCPVDGISGTAPQMDAYFKNENIFAEVKCHEIFDAHKKTLSLQYFPLLFGEGNDFEFDEEKVGNFAIAKSGGEFEIPLDKFGLNGKVSMFDFKQFICHLLGIKSDKGADKAATLMYLFFKPKAATEEQRDEIDALFDKLNVEIKAVFESEPIKTFAKKNNIKLKAVAEYAEVMSPLTTENAIILYQ